jgi:hypothetical protein
MSTTFTWNLDSMEVAPQEGDLTDVVKIIHWYLLASDGVNSVSESSMVRFGEPDPDNFIPFNDLTKEEVLAWLEATINVDVIKASLEQRLATLALPPLSYKRAPWAPNTDSILPE